MSQEKTKVFLLWSGYDEDRHCVGAFSSREIADTYAKLNSQQIENSDVEQLIVDSCCPPSPGMIAYSCYSADLNTDEVASICKLTSVPQDLQTGQVTLTAANVRKVYVWAANIAHAMIQATDLFRECVDKEAAAHQKFYGCQP